MRLAIEEGVAPGIDADFSLELLNRELDAEPGR